MKLENQVCNLELSKKLKELNVKQESLFYWDGNTRVDGGFDLHQRTLTQFNKERMISAFTVAELGEMLPEDYFVFKNSIGDYIYSERTKRKLSESGYEKWELVALGQENTEADARANILIYLLEQGLIKL